MGRDSGAIEEGADFVLGLWQQPRDERDINRWAEGLPDGKTQMDLICKVLKNRKGPANLVWKLNLKPQSLTILPDAELYKPPGRTSTGL
jgi:hypothetical protein